MNYSETVSYLSQAEKYGIVPGLDSIRRLMSALSDPQDQLSIVHIAGTNGKGSAGTFTESILRQSGLKTGRFVTPAVMDPLEIISINGKNISEEDFSLCMTKVREAADSIGENGFPHPTLFEMQTAAAFVCFYEQKCDIVLTEAGMGGKYDATNVIKQSLVSVITSVSMDHMQFLGNTAAEIAVQKSGIIKQNGRVVTVSQRPDVTDVIIKRCTEMSADLKIAKIYNISDFRYEGGSQYFSYCGYSDICINMLGKYQTENAVLAIETCKAIADCGYSITDEDIVNGLKNAVWPGRFEIIKKEDPVFIIDGAHNEAAAVRLRESIDICLSDKSIAFIMGTFKDKDYHQTVKITAKRAEKIFTVTPPGPRGLAAEELADTVREYNSAVFPCSCAAEAVKESLSAGTQAVVAFGSLSFLGEVRKCILSEDKND